MSLLNDKDFKELVPSTLNLFSLPPYQTSIFQHYFVNIRPLSQINDSSPLEFQVSNSGNDYTDLKRTRLHLKLKVVHADGTAIAKDEHVAPVNLFLQSLFSQVMVYLQGQLVTSANNHYAYKSIMKTLLDYGEDAKTTQLQSQLFFKDAGEDNDDIESTDPITGANSGLSVRGNFIRESSELTLSGAINEDILDMDRHFVNGVDMSLKFYRTSPAFCLKSGKTGQEYKIELLDAYLKVCKLKVNSALILAHNTLFQKSSALYPYTKTEVKATSIPSSQPTHTIDNVSSVVANRYIVAFVESDSLNGSYTHNPFNFQSSMIKMLSLVADGISSPARPVEADDVESYVNMFDGTGMWRKNVGNDISRGEFLLGNALFVFSLNPDILETDYLNLVKSGNVRLEIEFKSSLAKTLSCIVLSERNSIIEIDQARNVFVK